MGNKKFQLPDEVPRQRDESYLDRVLGADGEGHGVGRAVSRERESVRVGGDGGQALGGARGAAHVEHVPDASRQDETAGEVEEIGGPNAGGGLPVSSLPSSGAASFEEFERRWNKFMNKTQLHCCEIVFRETVGQGRRCYKTTNPVMALALGVSPRYTLEVLSQVEDLGFIRREELKKGKRSLGIKICFFITPEIR